MCASGKADERGPLKVAIARLSHAYRTPKPDKSVGLKFIGSERRAVEEVRFGQGRRWSVAHAQAQ